MLDTHPPQLVSFLTHCQLKYMSLAECCSGTTKKVPIWRYYYNWAKKYTASTLDSNSTVSI